jgi:hypothetical protein
VLAGSAMDLFGKAVSPDRLLIPTRIQCHVRLPKWFGDDAAFLTTYNQNQLFEVSDTVEVDLTMGRLCHRSRTTKG